jgi:rSAM-associated Gly-rich repeat protein
LTVLSVLSETTRQIAIEVVLMSVRQKYLRLISEIMPAGAGGILLLLGSAAPGNAALSSAAVQSPVSTPVAERLAAIRHAVSEAADIAAPSHGGDQQLAWGNWWRNGGWRNGGWRNGGWRNGGWRNGGWGNWHNGWHNGWPNWWRNW